MGVGASKMFYFQLLRGSSQLHSCMPTRFVPSALGGGGWAQTWLGAGQHTPLLQGTKEAGERRQEALWRPAAWRHHSPWVV